jgi:hypothetical protein
VDGLNSFFPWRSGDPNNAGYGANGGNYENCVGKEPGVPTAAGIFDVGCGGSYRYVCKEMRGWRAAPP